MCTICLQASDGSEVQFTDTIIGRGGVKDVYYSPDRSYVVAFYRGRLDHRSQERLRAITGNYRRGIFEQAGGEYWRNLFCWPRAIVEYNGRIGIVAPAYQRHFFFEYGSVNNDFLRIQGREKEGKWFASALNQNRWLDQRERGDWRKYFRICIFISRAIRRMHAAGLAHSDLSYKNILVDPIEGNATVIDLDGLVVPGLFPPQVAGTPDFIAPEVLTTHHLAADDPNKAQPCLATDQHALAVLVYMYLLYRHPLRGRKIHDLDDVQRDEFLAMGPKALFIEHSHDRSNRYDVQWVERNERDRAQYFFPWYDLSRLPYTILGPYLTPLVERAFMTGLHNPGRRPSANDWETALIRTYDLLRPCQNSQCRQKWFVFDSNNLRQSCPFCDTPGRSNMPILNFYAFRGGKFLPENHRLIVFEGQRLYQWHVNRRVFPSERLTAEEKEAVGYFTYYGGNWCFVNQKLTSLKDISSNKEIPVNQLVTLTDQRSIQLSQDDGGRVVFVQIVNH